MKTHFDWQTEESDQKNSTELADKNSSSPGRRPGCWVFTLLIAVIIAGSLAWLAYDTQSEAVAGVGEDVLLALELERQAIEKGDEELFSELLSSKDPDWKRTQKELFAENLVHDRRVFGLLRNGSKWEQVRLNLSPDLQKAEVSFVEDYSAVGREGNTPDLQLLHTFLFRFEDGRWKHAPADNSFWGNWGEVKGQFVAITYPERDAELAQHLAGFFDRHLIGLCKKVGEENQFGNAFCDGKGPWQVKLSTDVQALLNYSEPSFSRSSEFDYQLPAPTIVGVPLRQRDWDVYVQGYAKTVLQKMEMALLTNAPFPDQLIYALCFDHPLEGRNLYRYDWRLRSWQPVLPAQTFHFLSALPDDSALMLAENDTITVIDGNHDSESPDHRAVLQETVPALGLKILAGWIETADAPYFLVHELASGEAISRYRALDLHACDEQGCSTRELPGFPVASDESDASLFVVGSEIFLSKGPGEPVQPVGTGFNPFWIDGETFGFVRFEGEPDTGITTQVVLGDRAGSEPRVLFDGYDLSQVAAIPWGSLLYVHEVIPSPVDPEILLVSSTGIRAQSGNYFIFSLDMSDSQNQPALNLEVARSGSMGGVPGVFSPTGLPTFLVSPNGRWLAMAELNSQDRETWTIVVHDLQTGITKEVSNGVPAMPGNFPLLDWSGDGQWLLIGDRDFLHLFAPGHEYEEYVAHEFDACSQLVWAD